MEPTGSPEFSRLEAIFKKWNSWTIDVPGTYYLEVIEKLYKRNELASGSFVALGQRIELSRLRLPIYLLAGSADEVVAPEQLLALERLVGTPPEHLCHEVAPCNHLGLFMGKRTLEEYWPRIVRWLKKPLREPSWPQRYCTISIVVSCRPWLCTNSNSDLALAGLNLTQPWETGRPSLRISLVPWMA